MYTTVTALFAIIAGASPPAQLDSPNQLGMWSCLETPIPTPEYRFWQGWCNMLQQPYSSAGYETSLYTIKKNNGPLGQFDPSTTVYALWIGTNDVGSRRLLTGDQAPGATLLDTIKCAVNWVKNMYDGGARNFLFQNVMASLHRSPMYKQDAYLTRYWTIPSSQTEMTSSNGLSGLLLRDLTPTLHSAPIGIGLFNDIIDHPSRNPNGTPPLHSISCVNACTYVLMELSPNTAPWLTGQMLTAMSGTDVPRNLELGRFFLDRTNLPIPTAVARSASRSG